MLKRSDLEATVALLGAMAESARDFDSYAAAGVRLLPTLVASEMTTLSVCDLASGRREVVSCPAGRLGAADRACFDRFFFEHPLVRYHAISRGSGAHRISDSVPFARFRQRALYSEYYQRIGIDHAIALPLHVDERTLVSFVLNRKKRDFSDRDRAVLDLARTTLAALHRRVGRLVGGGPARGAFAGVLTPREREVMRWLAAGKSDRDIGEIVGCSHRTVQKHLQRIYEKLGVETRTAAVLRWLGPLPGDRPPRPM
jgi:DNA-binding CsgD family transcriptional regulator